MSDPTSVVTDGRAVSYGASVYNDDELRVCGDVKGKRVLELGLFGTVPNCVAMAQRGARSIAIDPSKENVQRARQAARNSDVVVEFHEGELADLGFLMNAAVDLAVCVHHIDLNTDIARLFRQVHRVLRPEAGFVFALPHPMSTVFDGNDPVARRRYGDTSPTIGDLTMALQRANFTIDVMHELTPLHQPNAVAPSTLVVRARKLGS
ncbi:MAG: methyltransferase domain-containing protein [Actinobacteria bacterium]|nr:methyltransferase domain-containing protein [Actinomycetota bacterium]